MNPQEEALLVAFRALSEIDQDMLLRFAKAHAMPAEERQAQILRIDQKTSGPLLCLIKSY